MKFLLPDDKEIFYNYFSDDDLVRLADLIREIEEEMPGEIRIAIRPKAPFTLYRKDIEKLAKTEFVKNQMVESQANLGMLFYFLLKEKKFSIVTTNDLVQAIPDEMLVLLSNELTEHFKKGMYLEGISRCITKVANILVNKYPDDYGQKMDTEKLEREIRKEMDF